MIARLKKFFTKVAPAASELIHIHKMTFVSRWQTDALGVPYGYDKYRCECGHTEERFWYV
jgi:hypothetical protein